VRVAEHALPEQREVLGELGVRVESGAGVVEVDVAARVQTSVLAAAKLVEAGGLGALPGGA
jgi:hypothetical protein